MRPIILGYMGTMVAVGRYGLMVMLLFFYSCVLLAQRIHVDARVVDAKTGEVLPFASVYISGDNNTITNAVGEFALDADSADVLRISYVGYKTVYLPAPSVGSEVLLSTEGEMLGEVVVLGTDYIINKVVERQQKEMKKHKKAKSNFFYRQVGRRNRQCTSFLESFFSGQSAYQLRDLRLVTGRYVSVASARTTNPTNFFTFAQVPIFSSEAYISFDDLLVPLHKGYHQHYVTDCEVISDGERRIYVVYFVPRNPNRWAVAARLYVDAETFEVLRYQGYGNGDHVWHEERSRKSAPGQKLVSPATIGEALKDKRPILPADYSFIVNYQHDHGFTEVQSVHFLVKYEYNGNKYQTTGMVFNVADRFVKGKGTLRFEDNLMKRISEKRKDRRYDRKFWEQLEVVKRTPVEAEVIELLERDNLFGVF